MPHRRFDWHERIKAVEREYWAARIAVDQLSDTAARDPGVIGGARRASPTIGAAEVEADFAPFQLQSRLEGFPGLRLEAPEQRAHPSTEQRLGGADADRLAGDRLPDCEPAALLPAAASIR